MARVAQRQASTAVMLCACQAEGIGIGEGAQVPFLETHHGGTLVREDGLVRVDADQELGAQLAGLQHGAGMAYGSEQLWRGRLAGRAPWWLKSKQPSTQMRASSTSTSC